MCLSIGLHSIGCGRHAMVDRQHRGPALPLSLRLPDCIRPSVGCRVAERIHICNHNHVIHSINNNSSNGPRCHLIFAHAVIVIVINNLFRCPCTGTQKSISRSTAVHFHSRRQCNQKRQVCRSCHHQQQCSGVLEHAGDVGRRCGAGDCATQNQTRTMSLLL
jgi:hypothetical protein